MRESTFVFQCPHCLAQGNLNTFREKTKRLDGLWGGSQALVQTPGGEQLSGVSPFGEATSELGFAGLPHIHISENNLLLLQARLGQPLKETLISLPWSSPSPLSLLPSLNLVLIGEGVWPHTPECLQPFNGNISCPLPTPVVKCVWKIRLFCFAQRG